MALALNHSNGRRRNARAQRHAPSSSSRRCVPLTSRVNMACSSFRGVPVPSLGASATHVQIVAHYVLHRRAGYASELGWFANQLSLARAIHEAALARDHLGKRLPHQRRLLKQVIPAAWPMLRIRGRCLAASPTFEALYARVERVMNRIHGAGPLYSYDTALRIGAFLRLSPKRVFVQTGSLVGAQTLLPGLSARSMRLSAFPPAFRVLAPAEMENLLCIYRAHL